LTSGGKSRNPTSTNPSIIFGNTIQTNDDELDRRGLAAEFHLIAEMNFLSRLVLQHSD